MTFEIINISLIGGHNFQTFRSHFEAKERKEQTFNRSTYHKEYSDWIFIVFRQILFGGRHIINRESSDNKPCEAHQKDVHGEVHEILVI